MENKVKKQARRVTRALFDYETNKVVEINSKKIGLMNRAIQLLITSYVIGYVMIYQKGYQESYHLTGSVTTKVKGIGLTNRSGTRKVWDVPDLVVPPQERKAVFITTNAIETVNQTQTTCAEDYSIPGASCRNDSDCKKGQILLLGNGVMTGRCLTNKNLRSCEIYGWCPLENDTLVEPVYPLFSNVPDYTILIKNEIIFDDLNVQRSNLLLWESGDIPKNCIFNASDVRLKYCPIFNVSTIIGSISERDLKQLLSYGGVIQVIITWNCNLDFSPTYCKPDYTFNKLFDMKYKISKGWNFRYANYYSYNYKEYRDLIKVFGLRIMIEVRGKAGKFSAIIFTMNLGSGVALLALATVICDVIIIYILPNRAKYYECKYEPHEDEDAYKYMDDDSTNDYKGAEPKEIDMKK